MNNVLYLVEGYHSASISPSGCLSLEVYSQKITIDEVRVSLKPFHLEEKKTFKDIFEFNNNNIAIEVVLKSEDNFYDDKETTVTDLNYYLQLVEYIEVTLLKTLDEVDLSIIGKIIKTFDLNIYHIETMTRCQNIAEVKGLLIKLEFYR